jgi:hypothetical protein
VPRGDLLRSYDRAAIVALTVPGRLRIRDDVPAAKPAMTNADIRSVEAARDEVSAEPDGVDGVNGSQISGGLTVRGSQRLAAILGSGPLPARLERVS